MIEKHESSSLIVTPKREDFFDFLMQAMASLEKCENTFSILQDREDGVLDDFEELEALEDSIFNDIQGIVNFAKGGISAQPSIIVGARDVVCHMNKFNEIVQDYIDCGLFLGDEEHNIIREYNRRVISVLLYTIWFEFLIQKHIETENDPAVWIDEIVKMYLDSYQLKLADFTTKIAELRKEYPFHLSVFDDVPELEADFEAMMGPLMGSLIESDLTIANVKDVLDGKMTPEELVELVTMKTSEMNMF